MRLHCSDHVTMAILLYNVLCVFDIVIVAAVRCFEEILPSHRKSGCLSRLTLLLQAATGGLMICDICPSELQKPLEVICEVAGVMAMRAHQSKRDEETD